MRPLIFTAYGENVTVSVAEKDMRRLQDDRFTGKAQAGSFRTDWRHPERVLQHFREAIVENVDQAIGQEWFNRTLNLGLKSDESVGWADFMTSEACGDLPTQPFAPITRWSGRQVIPPDGWLAPHTDIMTMSLRIGVTDFDGYKVTIYSMYPGKPTGFLKDEVDHIVFIPRDTPGEPIFKQAAA